VLFSGFLVGVTVVEARAEDLEATGIRVDGVVESYSAGSRLISERVDVTFTIDSEARTERIQLDDSSPRYEEGQSVVVLVDPDDADHISIEGETNQSAWTVWVMIIALVGGLGCLVSGPWALFRVKRQRRLLSAEHWRTVPMRYVEVPSGNTKRGLVLVTEHGTGHVLTLASIPRWNLGRTGLRDAHEAHVMGDPAKYIVIRVDGSERLTSARKPFTNRSRRRWQRQLG